MTVLLLFSNLDSFYFFLWLLLLGLLKQCWIKMTVDILAWFLILEGMLSAFHHWVYCYLQVSDGLYCVEVCSLYPHFLESFYLKQVLNFFKSLFCLYWDDNMVFILQFVTMVYHTDLFLDTETALHPCDKPHWIMVYDSFNILLDSVC